MILKVDTPKKLKDNYNKLFLFNMKRRKDIW